MRTLPPQVFAAIPPELPEGPSIGYAELERLVGIPVPKLRYYFRHQRLPTADLLITSREPRWKPSTIRAWLESKQSEASAPPVRDELNAQHSILVPRPETLSVQ